MCGEQGSIALEDDRITRWDFLEALPEDTVIRAGGNEDALGSGSANPGAISIEGHRRKIGNVVAAIRTGAPLAIAGREAAKPSPPSTLSTPPPKAAGRRSWRERVAQRGVDIATIRRRTVRQIFGCLNPTSPWV